MVVLFREYNIANVLKTRDRLCTTLVPKYEGKTLEGKAFLRFTKEVTSLLKREVQEVGSKHVDRSLGYLLGDRLTSVKLKEAFWRLAGNESSLVLDAVMPWVKTNSKEWVPVEIVQVKLSRGGRHQSRIGYELTFQILAGSPCPHKIERWWSRPYCYRMAYYRDEDKHGFGFQRRRGDNIDTKPPTHPFLYPNQFYGMRCMLLIDPERSEYGLPGYGEIGFTGSTGGWNKGIHKKRLRLKNPCPWKLDPVATPCYACPIGSDHCSLGAATHATTYVYRECGRCGNKETQFDPDDKFNDYCMRCTDAEILGNSDAET